MIPVGNAGVCEKRLLVMVADVVPVVFVASDVVSVGLVASGVVSLACVQKVKECERREKFFWGVYMTS